MDTFASQSKAFLEGLLNRANPAKPSTLANWSSIVSVHITPAVGNEPLETFGNAKLKTFAAGLRHLAPKTQHEVCRVVKAIIASAVDENGEYLYARNWNSKFVDLPRVENQHSPTIDSKTLERLLRERRLRYAVLYTLLAGTGLRISEALAIRVCPSLRTCWNSSESIIEVRNGIYRGQETISPKTRAAIRSVDVHPKLNQILQAYAAKANRKPGDFLFATKSERPISYVMVRRDLTSAGVTCGLHAFRRFRISQCRRARVNEDVLRFWVGHASRNLTDHYAKSLADDLELRHTSVLQAGLGFEVPARLIDTTNQPKEEAAA
jgi:integrase